MQCVFVQQGNEGTPAGSAVLSLTRNLVTGEKDFREVHGVPTTLESDLLRLASSVFATDRLVLRGEREDISRHLLLSVPIVNYQRLYPLKSRIERVLHRLCNDAWRLEFRQVDGRPEAGFRLSPASGRTLLFSGGLDSLAAAIDLHRLDNPLQLISHKTRNRIIDEAQRGLSARLTEKGFPASHHQFYVSSKRGGQIGAEGYEENSQRSRSFLFLVLAGIMARRSGHREIIFLAENGPMAIHLPLTHGRVGAFSTHTAHPAVLNGMEEVLSAALDWPVRIVNPYVHRTKRETIESIIRAMPEAVELSNSCWRNARLPAGVTHCGCCIPCYIRRGAVEYYGRDSTAYHRDPWSEDVSGLPENDIARRNLADLTELVKRIETYTPEDIVSEWPELTYEGLDVDAVIAMYRRFSAEMREVLARYPRLAFLLA